MNRIITVAFTLCFAIGLFAASKAQQISGGGGGGTPGGSSLDIQCNISGAFGACETGAFTYSAANHSMILPSGLQGANPQIAFASTSGGTGITSSDSGGFPNISFVLNSTIKFAISANSATATFGYPLGAVAFYTSVAIPPVATGSCAVKTQLGGPTIGSYVANGVCAAGTVTLAMPATGITNGWTCDVHDLTTPADVINQTASSSSSVTFTGTMANNDVVNFKCLGF